MFKDGYYNYKEGLGKYLGQRLITAKWNGDNITIILNNGTTVEIEEEYFNQMYEYVGGIRKEY